MMTKSRRSAPANRTNYRITRLRGSASAALVVALACTNGTQPDSDTTPEEVLQNIGHLWSELPFSEAATVRPLDATLSLAQDAKYFSHYGGTAPGFTEITLMAPKEGASNGGRLALVVAPGPCVSFEMAKASFGFAHKVPTHPGHPTDPFDTWQHEVEKGSLLLGYDPSSGCLVQATLQAD